MTVDEAKEVCQIRSYWRSIVSAREKDETLYMYITQRVVPCGNRTRDTLHGSQLPSHRANRAVAIILRSSRRQPIKYKKGVRRSDMRDGITGPRRERDDVCCCSCDITVTNMRNKWGPVGLMSDPELRTT
uniref:SFRICE_006718 n=1 Tax=Spodoptera frugiperda TaxID=7108 RepID=A0A2H1VIT9_SPOFR